MENNTVKIETLELNGNFRTTPTKESLEELAQSMKTQGILQPLVVRVHPSKKGVLQIIAGQRRYLAAKIAELKDIPVTIRKITDEEVPEIQIVENLQRSDVHPMQEAIAFKALSESNKKKSSAEISLLVGKNGTYVANRIKLNDLIPEYQKAFSADEISMHQALKVCKISKANQQVLWKKEKTSFNDWDLKEFIGDLNDAPFDLEDKTLNPDRGACSTCPYNSNNNIFLFPDAIDKGKCMDIGCYQLKTKKGVAKQIEAALSDPTVILASSSNASKEADKLIKSGHKVVTASTYGSADVTIIDMPEAQDVDQEDYDTDKEYQEAIAEANADLTKQQEQFDKKVASGKILKAVIVDGQDAGKIRYVEPNKKTAAKDGKKAVESGTASAADIKAVIEGINERQARALELDYEKVSKAIVEKLDNAKEFYTPKKLTKDERGALLSWVASQLGDDEHYKKLKLDQYDDEKNVRKTVMFSQEEAGMLFRLFMFQKFRAIHSKCYEAHTLREIANTIGIDVDAIQKEQDEIASRRLERVKARIAGSSLRKKPKSERIMQRLRPLPGAGEEPPVPGVQPQTEAEKKPVPLRYKPRKPSGEWAVFIAIWAVRLHRCSNCMKKLGDTPKPEYFSHIKGKGAYPELRLKPDNIQILCMDCHRIFDQGTKAQFDKRKNIHA